MLRSRNITGPSNGTLKGYNATVNAINLMQKEQSKYLDTILAEQEELVARYKARYDEFMTYRNSLANKVDFIDVLIANY